VDVLLLELRTGNSHLRGVLKPSGAKETQKENRERHVAATHKTHRNGVIRRVGAWGEGVSWRVWGATIK
jgi:hypothetical protein